MSLGESLHPHQRSLAAQDVEHRHQQQVRGRKPNTTPHSRIWDRSQITDQVEIGCGRSADQHKEDPNPRPQPMLKAEARTPVKDFESALGPNLSMLTAPARHHATNIESAHDRVVLTKKAYQLNMDKCSGTQLGLRLIQQPHPLIANRLICLPPFGEGVHLFISFGRHLQSWIADV